MQKDDWGPYWLRGGRIEDMVFVGKDVIAWCMGVHILFYHVVQHKETIRWCCNTEVGEGARCLSGHSSLQIFCFAERVNQPKILIYAYPSMTLISECVGGTRNKYLSTAFTARDHMVSVGWYPNFSLVVWAWRTGERIATVNTFIHDEVGQLLRITQVGPNVAAQMGRTCGKLYTWELDIVGKTATLHDHEIRLPSKNRVTWLDWCPTAQDPLLAITDLEGHVYLSNYNGSVVHRIILSQRCGICTEYEVPIVNWFSGGIMLRTTFCQMRYFSKNVKTHKWQKVWYVKLETNPCILVTHPVRDDRCFYHTFEGYLMQIDLSQGIDHPTVKDVLDYGASFKFLDFVYPWCHHVVGSDNSKELIVLETYSGTQVAIVDPEIQSEITCQASHPDYPMVVLGTQQGRLIFVSFLDPEEPKIIAQLKLQKRALDLIRFSHSGRSLIAAETNRGNCYCVSLRPEKAYTVLALVQPYRRISDALIYEGPKRLTVLLLIVETKQQSVGQHLKVYVVPEDKNLIVEATETLDLPGIYRNLWYHPSNPMALIGTPYLTRQLRVQRIQDFKNIAIVDGLSTGHYVKLANLFVDRQWLTTTALDGLVHVRDKTLRKVVACFMSHHRSDFGCVKAIVNRAGDLVVVLGYDGSLVAMKQDNSSSSSTKVETGLYRVDYTLYHKNRKKIESDYSNLSAEILEMLSGSTRKFPDSEENEGKTWVEWREELQLQNEMAESEQERTQILKDFEVLKAKVKALLDANETCPEIERLPVSAFDLDRTGRDRKLKTSRNECGDTRLELEHNIREMKRVSSWLRETFWEPQVVVGKALTAIFGDRMVVNYPSVAEDPRTKELLEYAQFSKDSVNTILEERTFNPWQVYSGEELEMVVHKCMTLRHEEDIKMDMLLEEDEEEKGISEEELAKQRALDGSIAHRFIEQSPCYSQFESYGFDHVMLNNQFLLDDCAKIRNYFNTVFEQVYALKEREMNVIRGRIERICYINSELQTMFNGRVSYIPVDPTWHWQESPEGVVKVFDHEVKARPYVSPSQQVLLDKQAAEAERIRLLLLADDFRERALMTMMDGVLEVRWEDVIKIDVPKPACMLEKTPEDYTEDDIAAVKKYEKDVEFLMEERERYHRMLEMEYTKVMGLLQDGIDRFNRKLDELFYLKMQVESAINQMHLRYIRGCLRNHRRILSLREEERIKQQLIKKQKYESVLRSNLEIFENLHRELTLQNEVMMNREKALTKRFKSEFASINKFHLELLEHQYKRRPRGHLRHLSSSELADLAAHVAGKARAVYLPSDSKDYLKSLDHLDARPNVLPVTLEFSHWEHLAKLRRLKIESELKIRSKEAEIADTEKVMEWFNKKIEKCMADVEQAKENLGENRRQRTTTELDIDLQFVMKMGQVEVELTGDYDDTVNVVLVPRNEILGVNHLIEEAGECKLEALSRLLDFKRGILLKEWIHGCRKKQLTDLQEDLHFLEDVNVTKDMQQYLKRKARGLPDNKTLAHMNVDIEAVTARCERMIENQRTRLVSIQKEIAITRSKNEELDRRIFDLNVSRCDMELRRDRIGEERQRQHTKTMIRMVMRRADLIKKLQDNYAELLELQTEHELLRLRRYPTFHFKFLDDNDK